MNWTLSLRTAEGTVSLLERREHGKTAVHKYQVVSDRRGRLDPERGATSDRKDLSKVTVRPRRTVVCYRGTVSRITSPPDRATDQLQEHGFEVLA